MYLGASHRRLKYNQGGPLFFSPYVFFKWVHIVGIVALVGNVSVTAVWKMFADRTRCWRTVAFAQRMVTVTDWSFTVGGILLLMVGGYAMAYLRQLPLLQARWLVWGNSASCYQD